MCLLRLGIGRLIRLMNFFSSNGTEVKNMNDQSYLLYIFFQTLIMTLNGSFTTAFMPLVR